ncbi:hypothetical protein Fleli_1944 [Bernardetia litoralis DSM 6794]|uniref:Uncharacterized protein n=1 Tax=Bernardetia litoralis (strain ATCC 23117 / DSM 6794 / NBRC 15988 / NCIMB 1366 / Fx l1 / Sio-4) TaxID=880071 RepID=I4AK47_BERLS|nr:hypothetical protein [Bernardetia litoralis]AFM04332.1 hypothetical protein Fleli_1944 [Bernardetia litoralis DSM 6794]
MKKIFYISVFTFLLQLIVGSLIAQNFSKEYWHKGEVYLFTEESVKGSIRYDLDQNNITIRTTDNKLHSYNASQVEQFWIQDELQKRVRYFYALPQLTKNDYRVLYFFELLTEGKITLLCRESFVVKQTGYYSPTMRGIGANGGSYVVQEDDYFVLNNEGNVIDVEENRETIMSLFGAKKDVMELYLIDHNNKLRNREDLLKLIRYYNEVYK